MFNHFLFRQHATTLNRLGSKLIRTARHGLFAVVVSAGILSPALSAAGSTQSRPTPLRTSDATTAQALADHALLLAARTGRDDLVRFALDNGADPNARDDAEISALMAAAATVTGYAAAVELIGAGASVKQTTHDGYNALMAASAHCRQRTLELLLLNGADPRSHTNKGRTALSFAAASGNSGCIKRLLAAGADPNAKNHDTGSILVDAISAGHARAVAALLVGGADPNGFGRGTQTPLMLAVRSGDLTLIALLLEARADPDAREHGSGNTALMLAANLGYADVVELLLDAGADPSIRAVDGWSAAQAAMDIGEDKLARRLEDFSAKKSR